jgi:hypothetical protein
MSLKNDVFVPLVLGLIFICLGIKTLIFPRYYFRGDYVDFTGYNIEVGLLLILIGIPFIIYCNKSKK